MELSSVHIMLRSQFNRPAFSIRALKSFLQLNPLDQSRKVSPASLQCQHHLLHEEPSVTHSLRDGGKSGAYLALDDTLILLAGAVDLVHCTVKIVEEIRPVAAV